MFLKNGYHLSILMYAMEKCEDSPLYQTILDELLANPNTDLNILDGASCTALQRAIHRSPNHAIRLAKDSRSNPNHADKDGTTALMEAAMSSKTETVRALVENPKTLLNLTDKCHRTALLLAVTYPRACCLPTNYNIEAIKVLLSQPGIEVDIPDNEGDTPLIHAVRYANNAYTSKKFEEAKDVILLLLKACADMTIENLEKESALSLAKDRTKQLLQNQSQDASPRFFPVATSDQTKTSPQNQWDTKPRL